jgi:hypothetical protein
MTPSKSGPHEIIPQWHLEFQKSFDMFTINVTGAKFNGEETVIDESGGLLGRMEHRVTDLENIRLTALEKGFKYLGYSVSLMFVLMILSKGMEHAGGFIRVLEWLTKL